MKLNIEAPINSLSLGNVTLNFLREFESLGVSYNFFPIGNNVDFSAYDNLSEKTKENIVHSINHRYLNYSSSYPSFKIWHINGSERRVGKDQYLYTFYECSRPTQEEINIVKAQKHVFFSSTYAADLFKNEGCFNVSAVPLGFDQDIELAPEHKMDVIHYSLIGKFEKRKNTKKIIKCWLDLYGDKPGYQLTLLVGNPFYSDDECKNLLSDTLGKEWSNVNVLGRLRFNSEVACLQKSTDIDLSGLSGGEGWNLPSFNATCLGKWSVVSNCSSHKDWANNENSILVEPDGLEPCYDDKFFIQGHPFNQGEFALLTEDTIKAGIVEATNRFAAGRVKNKEGAKLKNTFTYRNSAELILKEIF